MGNKVETIGPYAFNSCGKLTSVIIPDSVISIGDNAFDYCSSLASVIIGNKVEAIGRFAFNDCDKLVVVTFKGTITQKGFDDLAYFPGDLREKYFANSGGQGTYTRKSDSGRWSKE
jgi:hypothetical protein